ncbi:hypothetical protein K504DRAFT_462819 [Pleomassaria siparia CBS 279.74]|uniref:J domain-containing protein n=1 Tax=Pleomassaria siparia CBS 279.74 TaxID=1314801 RepID=A0A6G1JUN0_9PLEO|nr:hypothetical protein K504DRAFT_462819 [Pleomassaria siparia CBS 279.74]
MLFRNPSIPLSSYSGLLPLSYTSSPHPQKSCTSCRPSPSLSPPLQSPSHSYSYSYSYSYSQSFQARTYAQAAAHPPPRPSEQCRDSDLDWPDPLLPHHTPTPYQILSLRRGEKYSKLRFYELVKLYHPDRCHSSSPVSQLPLALRVERYRLLVSAHTILSDDEKRRAYDLWGTGWTGHNKPPTSHTTTESWAPVRREWPPGHDPMMNASWQDWERWYKREYSGQREEAPHDLYMDNFAFVSIVLSLVSVGLVLQGTRANMMSSNYMEQQERLHKAASMDLARAKRATMTSDREERIKSFLEHREAILAGDDAYQRLLPHPETCAPDTVRKQ